VRTGELARSAGVNIQTLRFYEREGLIREPGRTASGYRSYGPEDFERVVAIKQCQALGFSLDEVREILDLHDALAGAGADARRQGLLHEQLMERARARLAAMESKIAALTLMKIGLERLMQSLSGPGAAQCLSPTVGHKAGQATKA
jgi:DNA-binding transcriptional MerR regulator